MCQLKQQSVLLHRLVPVLMEVLLSDDEICIKKGLSPARL